MKLLFALVALIHLVTAGEARAATLIKAQNNVCLDVADGSTANGARLQFWACDSSNKNQQFTLSGGRIKAANGKCLDLKDGYRGNHGGLQLWDCAQGNGNQAWEVAGQNIRLVGTNLCLDVVDGRFTNGGQLQTYACDWRGVSNQAFSLPQAGGSAQQPRGSTNDATTFYGYPVISIDRFVQLHPECAKFKDAMVAAAADQGLHPTFLGAICETESSCSVPSNGFGPWQFSDDSAWRVYGLNKDRQNPWDAAYAAARYFKDLLRQTNNNLDQALRLYNGPLNQGGNKNYQAEVHEWMAGGNPWN